ncbi:MAG: hypothetical protein GW858_00850 [Sphingomonadales bacterium]|nr:hypothetical protein [Sphingomonadales bacterium]NCQ22664.1 hypothetical protein [Sphingomonadales bacterium]NCT04864.1 hypothetical protein [Sphingomonadales bacterium]
MALLDLGYPAHEYKTTRKSYRGTSLQQFYEAFPTDDACLDHMFRIRFLKDGCPKCGGFGDWYRLEGLRSFHHQLCHSNRSPTADTLLNGTRIPLQLWFYAMLHFTNSSHGLSRTFIHRHLGIAQYNAFRMCRQIRYQMAALDDSAILGGHDRPVFVRLEKVSPIVRQTKGKHAYARVMIANDGSAVRTVVITKSNPNFVRDALRSKAHPDSPIVTDCTSTFGLLSDSTSKWKIRYHPRILELYPELWQQNYGFLKYFLLMLRTQHKGVSHHRLWLYLKEAEFRYSRRQRSHETFWDLVAQFPILTPERKRGLERRNIFG